MTTPWADDGLVTVPYVTLAEFKADPTFIDYSNLISGGNQGQQDAELSNVLLRASSWAANYCGQRLDAHVCYEQTRVYMDRAGMIFLHPQNTPVRNLTGLAYGSDFQNLTQLTDFTQTWVEDSRGIVVSSIPMTGSWFGSLQFGGVSPNLSLPVYVQYSYVAGYCNTTLASNASSAATSLSVVKGLGLQPPATTLIGSLGGSTLRIWDPGLEEAVAVNTGYTTGSNTVQITPATANAHSAGAGVSELPAEVKQAVVSLTVALLMREDVSAEEPFPGAPYGPAMRRSASGGVSGGVVENAWMLLDPYRRVR